MPNWLNSQIAGRNSEFTDLELMEALRRHAKATRGPCLDEDILKGIARDAIPEECMDHLAKCPICFSKIGWSGKDWKK